MVKSLVLICAALLLTIVGNYIKDLITASDLRKGDALSNAINMSFDTNNDLAPFHHFADLRDPSIGKQCGHDDKHVMPYHCLLASVDQQSGNRTFEHWRSCVFSSCVKINIEPVFLRNPNIQNELKDILNNPCEFLPSPDLIHKFTTKYPVIQNHKVDLSHDIGTLPQAWEALDCSSKERVTITSIVSSVDDNSDFPPIIISSKVGKHYAR